MKSTLIFALGLLTGIGCMAATYSDTRFSQLIAAHTAAFNRQDAAALSANVSGDFIWYAVDGEALRVDASGAEAVRAGMNDYFRALPTVRARIENGFDLGPYTAVAERVSWRDDEGSRTQAAIAIYLRDGEKISRVWYFPATP